MRSVSFSALLTPKKSAIFGTSPPPWLLIRFHSKTHKQTQKQKLEDENLNLINWRKKLK